MKIPFTIDECYDKISSYFKNNSLKISAKKDISYRIQFGMATNSYSITLKIFHLKQWFF